MPKSAAPDKNPESESVVGDPSTVLSADDQIDTLGKGSSDVPEVGLDAPLNIEGLTDGRDIPVADKSARLKFEDEKEVVDLKEDKANKGLLFLGIIGILLTLGAVVGFYFLFIKSKPQQVLEVQPQFTNTKSQEAGSGEKLNREEWTFEVLNGSGVAGAAKTVASKLEGSGYKVVKTGNADKADYGKTTLFIATPLKDKESLVLGDIKELLGAVESGGDLKDSTASARLVVGKN